MHIEGMLSIFEGNPSEREKEREREREVANV